MAIKQNYVIYRQKTSVSKYGGRIFTIYAIGVKDRREYVTYIDPTNFNSQKWIDITTKSGNGFLVTGLNIKDEKKGVINADSQFKILAETHNPDPLLVELYELWKEQDNEKPPTNFRDLFE